MITSFRIKSGIFHAEYDKGLLEVVSPVSDTATNKQILRDQTEEVQGVCIKCGEVWTSGVCGERKMLLLSIVEASFRSVSYTHLDVYKRQIYRSRR